MQILKCIEHLVQEETACILSKALTSRVLDQVEHVKIVASQVLRDQVNVRVLTITQTFNMHDSIEVMAKHAQDIGVFEFRVIFDFFLNLLFV